MDEAAPAVGSGADLAAAGRASCCGDTSVSARSLGHHHQATSTMPITLNTATDAISGCGSAARDRTTVNVGGLGGGLRARRFGT